MTAPAVDNKVIDGTALAARMQGEVARRVAALGAKGVTPGLTVVLVGDDPASAVYVGAKERTCIELGMQGETIRLPATTNQAELLSIVDRLNADPAVHGILVQMPLPKGIDPDAVVRRIRPDKDVDGFHPVNVGKLWIGERDGFAPCTPSGVLYMLQSVRRDDSRRRLRDRRSQQHRGKADGGAHGAARRRFDRDDVPQQEPRPR